MNDRLGDIASWAQDDDSNNGDVEMASPQSKPTHMDHFFREVEDIKADIEAVKTATKSIGEINEAALQATTTDEENTLSQRLRPVIDLTNKRAKKTKDMLGLLKEENKKLKAEKTAKPADLRYVPHDTALIFCLYSCKGKPHILVEFERTCVIH